ncbi:AAA family ATPase [Campylobacter jejuni]|nr:ParA family protein [Campylobacter jejuni]EAJ8747079.1 ParA family protein [Campylobacter jejuni]ECP7577980.1 ParA family protein [Campylobacter jejuni]EDP2897548.1 AAA family ATPase [Campylobacter jejuni]QDQ36484.1 ParA family protein [Campylobacter jejuni]
MPMVITVTTEKGGSGKSTIAINIAFALKEKQPKAKILLIDCDPQGSINTFDKIRKMDTNLPKIYDLVKDYKLYKENVSIEKAKEIYDYIIFDSGGRATNEMRDTILVSDLAVIPTCPKSELDFDAFGRMMVFFEVTKKLAETIQDMEGINLDKNGKLKTKALAVMSMATSNPLMVKTKTIPYRDNIRKIYTDNTNDIILANNIICERAAFANSISEGKGVIEYVNENHPAYKEIMELTNEILNYKE